MKEPFANLDTTNIDEQIEQILHTVPTQQDDEEASYLRDLHYLYRKEEILARAQQRLMIAGIPEQTYAREDQPTDPGMVWRERSTLPSRPYSRPERRPFSWPKIAAVLAAAVVLIGALIGTASFFNTRPQPGPASKGQHPGAAAAPTINPATATAIAESNIVFSDPLSQNIHNWPVDQDHFFRDGAYHVIVGSQNAVGVVAQNASFAPPWSYTLTMTNIRGDIATTLDSFGVIFDYTAVGSIERFYTLEFGGGLLRLYKYDNSQTQPWASLWSTVLRFHVSANELPGNLGVAFTLKATALGGGNFTFALSNQFVSSDFHVSIPQARVGKGRFGMLVNLRGSEVAFQNMLITRA